MLLFFYVACHYQLPGLNAGQDSLEKADVSPKTVSGNVLIEMRCRWFAPMFPFMINQSINRPSVWLPMIFHVYTFLVVCSIKIRMRYTDVDASLVRVTFGFPPGSFPCRLQASSNTVAEHALFSHWKRVKSNPSTVIVSGELCCAQSWFIGYVVVVVFVVLDIVNILLYRHCSYECSFIKLYYVLYICECFTAPKKTWPTVCAGH